MTAFEIPYVNGSEAAYKVGRRGFSLNFSIDVQAAAATAMHQANSQPGSGCSSSAGLYLDILAVHAGCRRCRTALLPHCEGAVQQGQAPKLQGRG